jgi:hypothetical protein
MVTSTNRKVASPVFVGASSGRQRQEKTQKKAGSLSTEAARFFWVLNGGD